MTEYSRMAKGYFTSTGGAQVVNLPFVPDFVELINYTAAATPANHGIPFAFWDVNMIESTSNPTVVEIFNATPVLTSGRVLTGGISTFAAGQLLQFGPAYQHTGSTDFSITAANPPVVTTTTAHGLTSGDVVIFEGLYQSSTTGMAQMDGIPFTVTVLTATTFSVPWDASGSNYTAFDSSANTGNIGLWKKVLYPYIYFPGTSFISAITLGTTTTVSTTDAHNFVVGQEVAFRIPQKWGTVELNSLPNTLVPGSPVYGFVISVTDYHTVVVNINSNSMTAFNVNQTIASVPGLSYPQIVAIGDVNTGGVIISANSALYPPPNYTPIGTTNVNTINGPAIRGSYVNNTAQGFVVGNGNAKVGAASADTSSHLVGNNADVIFWRATLHDISIPV